MSNAIYGPVPDLYSPIQNKYYKWYMNIINNARNRGLNRKKLNYYTEKHHIIPESFFIDSKRNTKRNGWLVGNPNTKINLVLLTLKEHILCHWLLCYCYIVSHNKLS